MKDKPNPLWWVYIVRTSDDSFYTGITTDVERRLLEHQKSKRGARYFRGRMALTVVWREQHPDRSSASRREAAIKRLSRQQKLNLINGTL